MSWIYPFDPGCRPPQPQFYSLRIGKSQPKLFFATRQHPGGGRSPYYKMDAFLGRVRGWGFPIIFGNTPLKFLGHFPAHLFRYQPHDSLEVTLHDSFAQCAGEASRLHRTR